MNDEAFEATLEHVLRLNEKIRMLEDARADSMRVLESLSRGASLETVRAGADRLQAAAVPGRRPILNTASSPIRLEPGQRFQRRRGQRWPDLSRVPAVVYLLMHKNVVQYIGYSANIRDRLTAHGDKLWDVVEIIACESTTAAYRLEGDLIFQHQPPLNRSDTSARRHRASHS